MKLIHVQCTTLASTKLSNSVHSIPPKIVIVSLLEPNLSHKCYFLYIYQQNCSKVPILLYLIQLKCPTALVTVMSVVSLKQL